MERGGGIIPFHPLTFALNIGLTHNDAIVAHTHSMDLRTASMRALDAVASRDATGSIQENDIVRFASECKGTDAR